MLYRSTDCLCRRGAPVKNLAQSASLQSGAKSAPSNPGIKHLGRVIHPGRASTALPPVAPVPASRRRDLRGAGPLERAQADRAHDQAHARLRLGEDMLDLGTHRRLPGIGPGGVGRHRPVSRFLAVDAAHQQTPASSPSCRTGRGATAPGPVCARRPGRRRRPSPARRLLPRERRRGRARP
jgi:hypothetical protein